MKKIFLYALPVMLAAGFASCDNDELPNPPAQSNPQEPLLETVNVQNQLTQPQYDLEALALANEDILLATISTSELPAGYDFAVEAQIAPTDAFEKTGKLATTVTPAGNDSWNVTVTPSDLQDVYYSLISKTGVENDVYVRLQVLTVNGTSSAYVGNPNNYYGPYMLHVVPFPVDIVIEDAYYLIGDCNGWNMATAIPFNHVGDDVYTQPVFTLEVNVPGGNWYWKIAPQSAIDNENWDVLFGTVDDGDTSLSGTLTDSNANAGNIVDAGTYVLVIDMYAKTYNFAPVTSFIYVPGGYNEWNFSSPMMTRLPEVDPTAPVYAGYAPINGDFKFTSVAGWDGGNYGAGTEAGTLVDGSSNNFSADPSGLYYFDVNLGTLTFTQTQISSIGVIGDGTPGDWNNDTPLTPDEFGAVWTGVVDFKAGEFKFRMNGDWPLNLGGEFLNLVQNGGNLASPGEGTYKVVLNVGIFPYTCTLMPE